MAQELSEKIRAAAQSQGVDPEVALQIARAESGMKPEAAAKTSTAGGLFGVINSTWKEFGGAPGKKLDPDENIRVGTAVIAQNTNYLRSVLNRDPRPAEIYAAHYFGPTGARNFLQADPNTPIVDILGKKAVAANPNLKGLTAKEVMAQLERKMGGAPSKAAPAVPRETTTPAERIMEPALRSGMTAKAPAASRLEDLGAGYQAALALSFLADEEDEKERRETEGEASVAQKFLEEVESRPTALTDLTDISIKSPFAQAQPQQAAGEVPVQRLASGGMPFVPTARLSRATRQELDRASADFDRYNSQLEIYNKAVEAYNAGPRETDFSWSIPGETQPRGRLGNVRQVPVVRTGEPDAPIMTPEQYEAKAKAAQSNLNARNMALRVAANPEGFGFSMNRLLADGGEVKSTAAEMLKQVVPMDLRTFGSTLFGNRDPITEKNFTADELAAMQKAVDTASRRTGQAQKGSVQYVDYPRGEQIGPDFKPVGQTLGRFTYEKRPDGTTVVQDRYDFYNEGRKGNVEAYEKMGRGERAMTVSGRALKNLVTGNLRGIPDELADAYIGREGRDVTIKLPPVKRADGGDAEPTPEEIAAASRPATVNPNIRRQGEAARRLAAMRDVNTLPDPRTYAAVSGFLGTPPDQQGFSVMHPDIEGIKRAGEAGFGVGTVTQIAPLAGAVRNVAGRGTTQAAKALEGLKNIPVGASTRQVEPIFQHLPSAEAPFVGRLDEFVAGLPGSVQKDQFLGMLKGKFRDYDIARAQETLADLPGNAKLDPVELLNRVKTQYDPSQFKTTVLPPGKPGDYYQSMDNVYFDKDLNQGAPLGVIHLSQNLPPKILEQQMAVQDAGLAISRIATQGSWGRLSPEAADSLIDIVKNPVIPLSESTASKILGVARDYRALAEADAAWDAAKNKVMYPILDPRYLPMREEIAESLVKANPGTSKYDHFEKAAQQATQNIVNDGNQWLVSQGFPPVDLPDFSKYGGSPASYVTTDVNMFNKVTNAFDRARLGTMENLKDVKKRATEARQAFGEELREFAPYMGQHTSLGNPPSPISFSRFSEQVADIPGLGKREGIYVNELQSDLLDDVRKFGPKSGAKEKDEARVVELNRERKSLMAQKAEAQRANRLDEAESLGKKVKILEKKAAAMMGRMTRAERGDQGMYELSEAFAGMENSPQAIQQLMAKNAIVGAIQQGKSFVAFPGAESAQAQLYEKLPRNLKEVVKDLGPGFELRDIKLTTPEGRELMHPSIVWGPEAAARVQKKGVPFKDGGAVERQTADHRKYL